MSRIPGEKPALRNPVGRGAAGNPANRFLTVIHEADFEQLEFDDEFLRQLERPATHYFEDTSKSVISENDSPDLPFRFSLNPYRGCLHGCSFFRHDRIRGTHTCDVSTLQFIDAKERTKNFRNDLLHNL